MGVCGVRTVLWSVAMAAKTVATAGHWEPMNPLLLLLLSQASSVSGRAATLCARCLTVQSWKGAALRLSLWVFAVAGGRYNAITKCFISQTPQATFLGSSVLAVRYSCEGLDIKSVHVARYK